ncbi:uncharacterized protein N7483_007516 [Penicillium malachiteum]|uniref:uncharacterized protein n=1 Tax=Penicillium malachiteum TaxID=1324776 RepID=UPI002547A40C|nr:uncharacterized protein N7483_007516 [Penicillium malachiteum]KAJ5726159.1 hypothetical protein N7483_007516 [Penicillium malachiteum]
MDDWHLETPETFSYPDEDDEDDTSFSDEEDTSSSDDEEIPFNAEEEISINDEEEIPLSDEEVIPLSDEEDPAPRCAEFPYVVGNSIPLQVKTPQHETMVEAKIIRLFEPFTFSCAMVVRIDCPALAMDGNEDMVLKVFDRRFSWSSREISDVKPWSLELEKDFIQFASGEIGSKFVRALPEGTEEPPRSEWNTSQDEAFLEYTTTGIFHSETKSYKLMKDMQGTDIPRLLAKVVLPAGDLALPEPLEQGHPGVLLQYIPGFLMSELPYNAPRKLWQLICNDAARIIDRMEDMGVLNMDIHARSFIVKLDVEEATGFKVTLIDFGVCRFRDEYDNEQKWKVAKAEHVEEQLQEEGDVGHDMQFSLRGAIEWPRPPEYPKLTIDYDHLGPIPGKLFDDQ